MAEYEKDTGMPEDEGEYWSSEEEILEDATKRRKEADKKQSDWRDEATEMYKFVAGQQYIQADVDQAEADKRPLVTFNRVGPIVNAVCGQQICNRQETRFLPREQGDMQKAEVWGQVVAWAREQCDAEDEESDAFRDMVTTGIGWTCTNVVYDEDPAGMIREQRIDPRRMRWDPASRKKNFADARWVQCDYWYDDDEIEERWPDKEFEVDAAARFSPEQAADKPHDATNAWRYEKNNAGMDEIEGKYRVIHEIHWRLEDTYQIPDMNGQITKLTKDEWEQLQSRLETMGQPIPQVATTKSRQYYECWFVGNTVLHSGEYPIKTGFEYQAMTGLRDEDGKWYGLVKPLTDPQRFANKTFTQIVAILNSNAKGGIVVEDGAVDNHSKFENEWSRSDGVAWVNDGAVSNGRIQPKPPPQIPAELTKLLEYSVGGMREVTGVNVEFLGQTDKVQPGVVEAMRTKAGLVILAPWFDAMRLYMKRQGRLLAEFINTYIADGRWIRITGDPAQMQPQQPMMPQGMQPGMPMQPGMEGMQPPMPQQPDGMQYIQLIKQPDVAKYDIIVDESTQSRDARERYFQALMQVVPMALQSGVPIPAEVIDYAPLPETLRMKWKAKIQEQLNAPKQPPLALQIEQMRGETQKQIEQMRAEGKQMAVQQDEQLKQNQIMMQAEAERVTQAAQAESQRMVDQSKLHLEATMGMLEQNREKDKMMLDAKLSTFETILNAVVDLQKSRLEAQQTPPDVSGQVVPQVMKLLEGQNSQMVEVMRLLAAPEEVVRDEATGRAVGKRKVLKDTAKKGDDVQSQLTELLKVLAAPTEVIRDPKTGKATGTRRVLN